MNREEMMPEPPKDIDEHDRRNFIRHFENRDEAEKRYFGKQTPPDCETLVVTRDTLNTKEAADFVRKLDCDAAIIFGTALIKDPLLSTLPEHTLNMHLGLSPRYRGSATLFWPFYFLEPQYAGSTFHYIVAEPDAGNIVHQVVPPLALEDHIHDTACKTVIQSASEAVELFSMLAEGNVWEKHVQKSTGKLFLSTDFHPSHLRVIYDTYDDAIVKAHLDGTLKQKKPKLIRQF